MMRLARSLTYKTRCSVWRTPFLTQRYDSYRSIGGIFCSVQPNDYKDSQMSKNGPVASGYHIELITETTPTASTTTTTAPTSIDAGISAADKSNSDHDLNIDSLNAMNFRKLQKLARVFGVKANDAKQIIVHKLAALKHPELQHLYSMSYLELRTFARNYGIRSKDRKEIIIALVLQKFEQSSIESTNTTKTPKTKSNTTQNNTDISAITNDIRSNEPETIQSKCNHFDIRYIRDEARKLGMKYNIRKSILIDDLHKQHPEHHIFKITKEDAIKNHDKYVDKYNAKMFTYRIVDPLVRKRTRPSRTSVKAAKRSKEEEYYKSVYGTTIESIPKIRAFKRFLKSKFDSSTESIVASKLQRAVVNNGASGNGSSLTGHTHISAESQIPATTDPNNNNNNNNNSNLTDDDTTSNTTPHTTAFVDDEEYTINRAFHTFNFLQTNGKIPKRKIMNILHDSISYYQTVPNVVRVKRYRRKSKRDETPLHSQIHIVGDVHGQFADFCQIFTDPQIGGFPALNNRYVFNGDIVDRGGNALEIFITLLLCNLVDPNIVTILRGNHETTSMNSAFGFEAEVLNKYDIEVLQKFRELFRYLPLMAVIEKRVGVMHGGLGKVSSEMTLNDLNRLNRVVDEPDPIGAVSELLWSDPRDDLQGLSFNTSRGGGHFFGVDITSQFLENNDLSYLVRSHEVAMDGYSTCHDGKCITIFSAPNYCGVTGNLAAIIRLDSDDLTPKFKQFAAVGASVKTSKGHQTTQFERIF